jgi:tRNA nucleotidyltransferase (CCA-adding enzyme)
MPDYMFLLESRLSPEQRAALVRVQELARAQDSNVYLTGGAVRDLISGMPIRDLDFTVEGNPQRIVRELEKGGARTVSEDERLRHYEVIFAGDADGSVSAARDDVYERPGAKPEYRWSTVMEDLRRRDFSINAIAISLNPASRGLLLDPTNGLADLEKREVRALSIHAFTNQPIRLLRILRYSVRMGFKQEPRTEEWFDLAIERGLHQNLEGYAVGREVLHLGREDNPSGILKQWESHELIAAIHPSLPRRHPDYDGLSRLQHAREAFLAAGVRPRLALPVLYFLLARLKSREAAAALRHLEFSAKEVAAYEQLVPETEKALKILKGRKTNAPKDAYFFLTEVPPERLAFLQAEYGDSKAVAKIRNYLQKWRPMRASMPVAELDALAVPRGPKFDKILEDFFEAQLRGKGRDPIERTKILKKLAGIKDEPKKKIEEKKKSKARHKAAITANQAAASGQPADAASGHAASSKPAKPEPEKAKAVEHAKPATEAARKHASRRAGKIAKAAKKLHKS